LLGAGAAAVFLLSLLASCASSSVVGTMAGQMIMQGFVGFRIPVWLRRIVTMAPALGLIALGANATDALVYSQVVLSFALPVPMIVVATAADPVVSRALNSIKRLGWLPQC
jgi:manganese transport protein